jgi:hypothetical protein
LINLKASKVERHKVKGNPNIRRIERWYVFAIRRPQPVACKPTACGVQSGDAALIAYDWLEDRSSATWLRMIENARF